MTEQVHGIFQAGFATKIEHALLTIGNLLTRLHIFRTAHNPDLKALLHQFFSERPVVFKRPLLCWAELRTGADGNGGAFRVQAQFTHHVVQVRFVNRQ